MNSEAALLNRRKQVDPLRHELGTVVEAHVGWSASLASQALQDVDDAAGVDATINVDREGLAGEVVDHVEHFASPFLRRGGAHVGAI